MARKRSQIAQDKLFKDAPENVQELNRQARRERRQKDREAFKRVMIERKHPNKRD